MQNNLNELTTQVRRDILRMVHKVNSGHPGGSLGCTEFLVVLYNEIMIRKEEFDMDGINEDIFFLSNGHISPVFYSVLARTGYFPIEELNTFRLLDSRLQGHPTTHEGLPGIRIASGSLGQGLSVALGAAVIEKHFTLDRNLPGPDHKASLEPGELKVLVSGIRNLELALGDGNKHIMTSELGNLDIIRKSIVARKNIIRGEVFTSENLTTKRPGNGISPMQWDNLIGKVSKRDYLPDELVEL